MCFINISNSCHLFLNVHNSLQQRSSSINSGTSVYEHSAFFSHHIKSRHHLWLLIGQQLVIWPQSILLIGQLRLISSPTTNINCSRNVELNILVIATQRDKLEVSAIHSFVRNKAWNGGAELDRNYKHWSFISLVDRTGSRQYLLLPVICYIHIYFNSSIFNSTISEGLDWRIWMQIFPC